MATQPTGSGALKSWVALASGAACAGALLSLDTFGCGSSPEAGYATDGGGTVNGGSSGGGSSSGGVISSSSSGGTVDVPDGGIIGSQGDDAGPDIDAACPSGAGKYIYVATDQNDLYTFDPTLVPSMTAFTKLGALNCPGETTPPPDDSSGVNSMAVDRSATAWVNFDDGKIFKVDTTQASLPCTDTGYSSGQGGFTPQLGMGFATTGPKAVTEVLYVSDNTGPGGACMNTTPSAGCMGLGLGWIDTTSMTMTTLGAWGSPVAGYNAELSGTGDGLLYGFFTTTPSDIAQIDKTSGNVSGVTPLPTVNNSVGGYAFSFWGGDFWTYTASDANGTTSVTHVVTADGGVSVVMPDIGFTIVGAGASTCVPTVPPPPPQ